MRSLEVLTGKVYHPPCSPDHDHNLLTVTLTRLAPALLDELLKLQVSFARVQKIYR